MPLATERGRPLRRDAQRSLDALTKAASEAFLAEGLDVSVDEIARRAGVGVATLYRRFPTKADLIEAVTNVVLDELDVATASALDVGDPGEVLARFLTAAMAQQQANRGFLEALGQHGLNDDARGRLTNRVLDMLEPVAAVSHANGTLHPDLKAKDLLVAVRMAGAAATVANAGPPDRYVSILLGGLARPQPAS